MAAALSSTKITSGPISPDGSQELELCIHDHTSICAIVLVMGYGTAYCDGAVTHYSILPL